MSRPSTRRRLVLSRGFTLVELLVVMSVVAMLMALLLPALAKSRVAARQTQNNIQLRNIHSAMLIFSQSNNGFYPGIKGSGNAGFDFTNNVVQEYPSGAATSSDPFARSLLTGALRALVRYGFLTSDQLIAPGEPQTGKRDYATVAGGSMSDPGNTSWTGITPLLRENYSYGMFAASERSGYMYGTIRWDMSSGTGKPLPWSSALGWADTQWYQTGAPIFIEEWQNTGSATTPMVFDRYVAADATGDTTAQTLQLGKSIWTRRGEQWAGAIVWNDSHVTWEKDPTRVEWKVGRAGYTGRGLLPTSVTNVYSNNNRVLLRH